VRRFAALQIFPAGWKNRYESRPLGNTLSQLGLLHRQRADQIQTRMPRDQRRPTNNPPTISSISGVISNNDKIYPPGTMYSRNQRCGADDP
tara:strand:+ start:244 stop:516 length:273 start_codon:yes stop_codon:yes gene_type:complete